ncbi:hypothetical protein KDA06_01185 [Candidatus Saccharibacteria bacterium]|nr:hypothetical protein [Candidatus Saccharibacteria bacterium]
MIKKTTKSTTQQKSIERTIGVALWLFGAVLLVAVIATILGISKSNRNAAMTPAQMQESRATIESEAHALDAEGAEIDKTLNTTEFDVSADMLQ